MNRTTVERRSERELVVTRTFNAPARLVFEAWTRPELFKRWWVPKSIGVSLVSCEMDVRVGGGYRLVFSFEGKEMAFFGTYREVAPHARLVWTNDEAGEAGQITTVTFEEKAGKTVVVLRERYPSKEALDGALASGSGVDAMPAGAHRRVPSRHPPGPRGPRADPVPGSSALTAPRPRLRDAPELRRHGDALPTQRGRWRSSAAACRSATIATSKDLVSVGDETTIGSDPRIKEGASVGDRVQIGDDVEIKAGVVVPDGAVIRNGTTLKS